MGEALAVVAALLIGAGLVVLFGYGAGLVWAGIACGAVSRPLMARGAEANQ